MVTSSKITSQDMDYLSATLIFIDNSITTSYNTTLMTTTILSMENGKKISSMDLPLSIVKTAYYWRNSKMEFKMEKHFIIVEKIINGVFMNLAKGKRLNLLQNQVNRSLKNSQKNPNYISYSQPSKKCNYEISVKSKKNHSSI